MQKLIVKRMLLNCSRLAILTTQRRTMRKQRERLRPKKLEMKDSNHQKTLSRLLVKKSTSRLRLLELPLRSPKRAQRLFKPKRSILDLRSSSMRLVKSQKTRSERVDNSLN